MQNVIKFKDLTPAATAWYAQGSCYQEGLPANVQVLMYALELGMPTPLQGDADGAMFVYDLREAATNLWGMAGLRVLYVHEDLSLEIIAVSGYVSNPVITLEELLENFAVVTLN